MKQTQLLINHPLAILPLNSTGKAFRLTPLLISLLLVYPAMQARQAQAADNNPGTKDTLPTLGQASESPGTLNVGPNGATFDNRFDGKRIGISP